MALHREAVETIGRVMERLEVLAEDEEVTFSDVRFTILDDASNTEVCLAVDQNGLHLEVN